MTFSQEKPQTKKENYFLSQVHQPFFTLGISNTIIMMLIFALGYKGVLTLSVDALFFHVYSLIFIVFINIFTGFLFTTYPKYTGMNNVEKPFYKKLFYINLFGFILFLIGALTHVTILLIATTLIIYGNYLIVKKLKKLFENSTAANLEDPFWMLRAFKFGLAGNILMVISIFIPVIQQFAIALSFFMFLIFLTFAVGQRMIPFFSHSMEEKDERFIGTVFVLFIIKTILATFNSYDYVKIAEIIVDILLGLYMLGEFLKWKILDKNAHPIIWILHLGLFWLPAAFVLDAISLIAELYLDTSFYFLGIHLIALGFLTTILIGFGTRVTYGHSGQPPQAEGLVLGLFYFTQIVVLTRFLYSLNIGFSWGLNFLFDISFTTWLILFVLWAAKFLPVLVRGAK
ncbi:NnrS family protein [Sulfurimonas lithotrophica]|uniref:NnrS family protein n=1 Tax=Sulfurimonas lithotrophica TaxID=2590022 RepID=UPI00165EFBA0|nr:NnrS family protein [Sulfurimonas lithotrophica]